VTRPSIFEFAGGESAFQSLAAAHHSRCLADPVLNHPFSHPDQNPEHVRRLGWYWAEVFGGPARFSEACGDHSGVLALHAGMEAQDDLGDLFLACFLQAVEDARLPGDPEFRAALRAYMEWATAEVMSYNARGSAVAPGKPVPRWTWNGLQRC
jgi:hemoglobin